MSCHDIRKDIQSEGKLLRGLDPSFHYPSARYASAEALKLNIPHFVDHFGIDMLASSPSRSAGRSA